MEGSDDTVVLFNSNDPDMQVQAPMQMSLRDAVRWLSMMG